MVSWFNSSTPNQHPTRFPFRYLVHYIRTAKPRNDDYIYAKQAARRIPKAGDRKKRKHDI